jgi:uncharacterized membrane protein YraQ (UPF0718 family)
MANDMPPIAAVLITSSRMFWEVFWPLALGFLLSAIIQALVSKKALARVLGCDQLRCLSLAALFGAASSSCSYAAVALARSLFRKGASFVSSMVFEIASTNLVIELGIVLYVLMGWQFMLAEVLGGLIMIFVVAAMMRLTLAPALASEARAQAERGIAGRMEGHAEMEMGVSGNGPFLSRFFSRRGMIAVSHLYITDWLSVWIDVAAGFLLAGILALFVPDSFWQSLFLNGHPLGSLIIGPLVGPLIAIISFVCSVGNIPLALVLWQSGISFGGVVSFIFADLLVLPILNIYRRYYGAKMMLYIAGVFYLAMVAAGYAVEIIFFLTGMIPIDRHVKILSIAAGWDYTAVLNAVFLAISGLLLVIFLRTDGPMMLRMMKGGSHHGH